MKNILLEETFKITGGQNEGSIEHPKELTETEYPIYTNLNKMCVHNERTDDRRITG